MGLYLLTIKLFWHSDTETGLLLLPTQTVTDSDIETGLILLPTQTVTDNDIETGLILLPNTNCYWQWHWDEAIFINNKTLLTQWQCDGATFITNTNCYWQWHWDGANFITNQTVTDSDTEMWLFLLQIKPILMVTLRRGYFCYQANCYWQWHWDRPNFTRVIAYCLSCISYLVLYDSCLSFFLFQTVAISCVDTNFISILLHFVKKCLSIFTCLSLFRTRLSKALSSLRKGIKVGKLSYDVGSAASRLLW
jgi:hypothetical protein